MISYNRMEGKYGRFMTLQKEMEKRIDWNITLSAIGIVLSTRECT